MASRDYCTNVSAELEVWSDKLHELSDKIQHLSTGEKFKLFPQVQELNILMTELDDRLCEMLESCPLVEGYATTSDDTAASRFAGKTMAANIDANRRQLFDYDFGG